MQRKGRINYGGFFLRGLLVIWALCFLMRAGSMLVVWPGGPLRQDAAQEKCAEGDASLALDLCKANRGQQEGREAEEQHYADVAAHDRLHRLQEWRYLVLNPRVEVGDHD